MYFGSNYSFFSKYKSCTIYLIKENKFFWRNGNCATCHALQDANSDGNIGPNLNEIKPDIMRIILAVTNGIGVMPAYEGQLSTEEIKAVATYVAKKY